MLTYLFLQIFIIFDGLPDSRKKSKTFSSCKLPFNIDQRLKDLRGKLEAKSRLIEQKHGLPYLYQVKPGNYNNRELKSKTE